MPATYQIDLARRLVTSTGTGRVVIEEMVDHQIRLKADPLFQPEFSQLVDFTNVEAINITSADVVRLAEIALFAPTARRAVVAPSPLHYGFSRMYGMLRELAGERGIKVVRTREEAMRWIEKGEIDGPTTPEPI